MSAGLASSYVINARMTQTIAHLRGYDVDSDEVQTVVLATLLGSSGAAAIQKAGIEVGNKTLLAAVQKVPGRVLIDINKPAASSSTSTRRSATACSRRRGRRAWST